MHILNENDIVDVNGDWIGFFGEDGEMYKLGGLKALFG